MEANEVLRLKTKRMRTYLFYGWIIFVSVFSVYSFGLDKQLNLPAKAVHFSAYFVMTFMSYIYFYDFVRQKKLLSIAAVSFSCAYGALMEFLQYFVARGNFSKDDIIFNCVGALVLGIIVIPKRSIKIYGRKV